MPRAIRTHSETSTTANTKYIMSIRTSFDVLKELYRGARKMGAKRDGVDVKRM